MARVRFVYGAALLVFFSATAAFAHGGNNNPNDIHACVGNVSKIVRIVGLSGQCLTSPTLAAETAIHWPGASTTTTADVFALMVLKAGTGAGTVSSAGIDCGGDCTEVYPAGTTVVLSAAPANGSAFDGWSGDCTGTGNCTVTMDAARSVTASFSAVAAQTCTTNDAFEPNETRQQASFLGSFNGTATTPHVSALMCPGEHDWYRIRATGGTFAMNDAQFTLTWTSGTPMTFELITSQGTQSLTASNGSITLGPLGYGDNTDVFLHITGSAASTNIIPYGIDGHL